MANYYYGCCRWHCQLVLVAALIGRFIISQCEMFVSVFRRLASRLLQFENFKLHPRMPWCVSVSPVAICRVHDVRVSVHTHDAVSINLNFETIIFMQKIQNGYRSGDLVCVSICYCCACNSFVNCYRQPRHRRMAELLKFNLYWIIAGDEESKCTAKRTDASDLNCADLC